MFKNLTNFSYQRSLKEAIGFYVAYLIFAILLSALAGGLGGLLSDDMATGDESFQKGVVLGAVMAVIFCLLISALLLKAKKLYRNFGYLILVLIAGFLALLGGGLLGLVVPTYLSTRETLT